jgi:histidinol phosphatase-like PHP family hydrolase
MERFVEQAGAIAEVNARHAGRFRLLRGVEANIGADGVVDVDPADRAQFDIVLAAPHSGLRSAAPQTERMLAAVAGPGVHILAHPRGRKLGERPGVAADWPRIFEAAAAHGVAIEIDGDPHRQDLDFDLVRAAVEAGCLIAVDSDAHAVPELVYADIALAHAAIAGVPPDRIVNCWPLERVIEWAESRRI